MEEAQIVVIACDKVEFTEANSRCVQLVVLDCGNWWQGWTGNVIDVYGCSNRPLNRRLLEAIYTVSVADAVVVWNCDSVVLGVMLGLLGKKFGARLVLVGSYPDAVAGYADLVLTTTSLSQLFSELERRGYSCR